MMMMPMGDKKVVLKTEVSLFQSVHTIK